MRYTNVVRLCHCAMISRKRGVLEIDPVEGKYRKRSELRVFFVVLLLFASLGNSFKTFSQQL